MFCLVLYIVNKRKIDNIFLCLQKFPIYIVVVLSSVPVEGQALSLEDIIDKKRQVSGVVQPNTLDKWK